MLSADAVAILPDINLASPHGLTLRDAEGGLAGMAGSGAGGDAEVRAPVKARKSWVPRLSGGDLNEKKTNSGREAETSCDKTAIEP